MKHNDDREDIVSGAFNSGYEAGYERAYESATRYQEDYCVRRLIPFGPMPEKALAKYIKDCRDQGLF